MKSAKVVGGRCNSFGKIIGEIEVILSESTVSASTYLWVVNAETRRTVVVVDIPAAEFKAMVTEFLKEETE